MSSRVAHADARRIHRMLAAQTYRHENTGLDSDTDLPSQIETDVERMAQCRAPYFEVLIVDEMSPSEEDALRRRVQRKRSPDDDFMFDVLIVPSFEDALIASLVNFNLQAVVIRHGFPFRSIYRNDLLRRFLDGAEGGLENVPESERGVLLGQKIAELRPELDLYLVTDDNVEEIAARAGEIFKRIFFREEDHIELYNSIMKGVGERYRHAVLQRAEATTPSSRPACSTRCRSRRGKSIMNSHWIQRHGAVLRHEHVPGRDLGHLAAGSTRCSTRSAR